MATTGGQQIAVVGGGVVGMACALNLQSNGAVVVVYDDQTGAPPASWGNAGHIAIEQVEPIASPKALRSAARRLFIRGGALDFRWAEIGTWGPWAFRYVQASQPKPFASGCSALEAILQDAMPAWRRLVSSIEAPELLREDGHLVLWETAASAVTGRSAWSAAMKGQARFQSLDIAGLELPEASKARLAGGIQFSGTGQISDLTRLLAGMRRALVAAGGEIRTTPVKAVSIENGRANLLLTGGETVDVDQILVAAGVGSGRLMRSAGHFTPIIAERGYHIEGDAGTWPFTPPLVFEDRSMIVTRFQNRLRAASFVEFARPSAPADPRKWRRLEQHVRDLGLPLGEPRTCWMGARPTLPDYLPAIGVSRRAENLTYAFGHQHLGLTLAATTGEIVAKLATGEVRSKDLSAFDIERFERGFKSEGQRLFGSGPPKSGEFSA